MRWTFKNRLVTGFVLTGLAVCSVGTAAVVSLARLRASTEDLVAAHAENLAEAERLRADAEQVVASGRGYLLTGHDRYLERAHAARDGLRASLARLWRRIPPDAEVNLAAIEAAERSYESSFERTIALRLTDSDPTAVTDSFEKEMRPRRDALEVVLDAFIKHERLVFDEKALAARRTAEHTTALIIVVASMAVAVDVLTASVVTHRLARLHAATESAKSARERALSIVAHELRTPLSTLGLQLQLLRRESSSLDEATQSRLGRLSGRMARIVRLLDNLLDASRIESGRLPLEVEEVDLVRLVREVVQASEAEIEASGCTLEVCALASIVGRWDPLRLEQIVNNLLSNALKYGANKPVELVVEPTDTGARIVVRDHGVGISPEDQSKLFEAFERGGRERDHTGFGLGLWIVKQIVDSMGARITVTSQTGQGSTFTVELPRKTASRRMPSAA